MKTHNTEARCRKIQKTAEALGREKSQKVLVLKEAVVKIEYMEVSKTVSLSRQTMTDSVLHI